MTRLNTIPHVRALVARDIVIICLLLAELLFTARLVNSSQHKWCQTIGLLTAQKPPAGPAAANPGRGYEQKLYADFRQLRGCTTGARP